MILNRPRRRADIIAPPRPQQHSRALCTAILGLALAAALPGVAGADAAATPLAQTYDVPAGPLVTALDRFARTAGINLTYDPVLVQGATTRGLTGRHAADRGLSLLLAGSGIAAVAQPGGGYVLRRAPSGSGTSADDTMVLPPLDIGAQHQAETARGPVDGYLARRSATGTKTDTPIAETPQSVSVVTADRIRALGAVGLKEAIAYTPGVDILPYGADSRYEWISVRGFDAYSPGYYLDGLPLRNAGTWGVWQTETYGVERIEVLRGPASVLYGQAVPGGLVNIVSKLPTTERLNEVQAQVGSFDRRQLAGDFAGALTEDGTFSYRLTGLFRDADLPAGNMDDDRLFIAPALTWAPTDDTSLTLMANYIRTRAGVYTRTWPLVGALIPTPDGNFVPAQVFNGDAENNQFDQDQWQIGYQFQHRFNETWQIRQAARYGEIELDYVQVSGGGFVPVNNDPTDPANYQTVSRSLFASFETVKGFAIDNNVEARFSTGIFDHTLILGLDYQTTSFDEITYSGGASPLNLAAPVYGGPLNLPAPYVDAEIDLEQTGVYVQDQIRLGDQWVLTLGGRYDDATATIDSRLDGSTTEVPDDAFTGRAGLVYLSPTGLAPYLSYSESFLPTATIDPLTGRPLEPETGRQYEAGLRYLPPGRDDSYSVAVFELTRQNYITYDANFTPRQIGEVMVRGLELEAIVKPLPNLNVTFAYTWTPEADVTKSADPDQIGKQGTAISEHKASLWADYRFDIGLTLGLGVRYTGSNLGYEESAADKVPDYALFDALVGYELGPVDLALNIRNLGGETYVAQCYFAYCYFGDERRVTATASYRW